MVDYENAGDYDQRQDVLEVRSLFNKAHDKLARMWRLTVMPDTDAPPYRISTHDMDVLYDGLSQCRVMYERLEQSNQRTG